MTTSPNQLLTSLLPDPDLRRRVARAIASSIQQAHELNPASWEVGDNSEKLVLKVGRHYALSVQADRIQIAFCGPEQLAEELKLSTAERFKIAEDARMIDVAAARFDPAWERLRESHRAFVELSAGQVARTPYYYAHSREAVRAIAEAAGVDLPQPDYLSLDLRPEIVPKLVALVESKWPQWTGFGDPRHLEEERDYKVAASELARDRLSAPELRRLIASGDHDAVVERLEEVGRKTNLLYQSVPAQGDLALLYQDNLDRAAFANELLELLHGEGESPERLERFVAWVDEQKLPNKWTFPTYFLFLVHPESEIFVKPTRTTEFFERIGAREKFSGRPDPDQYRSLLSVGQRLLVLLEDYDPRDMIDVQSLMWLVATASLEDDGPEEDSSTAHSKIAPTAAEPEAAFTPQTFQLLDELHENPTRDFYNSRKEEFREHVESRLQDLFRGAIERLPEPIRQAAETERYLFSQIPKNDYGRGGAWPFYWGAIYGKGGKRTSQPQLFVSLRRDLLEAGFYIGDYAERPMGQFLRNLGRLRDRLVSILETPLARHDLFYGSEDAQEQRSESPRLEEWLTSPSDFGFRAAQRWTPEEVLGSDREKLLGEIVDLLVDLFPLFLLATSEDPLPAIEGFFGPEPEDAEIQPEHSLAAIAEETGFPLPLLQRWKKAIDRKGQAVFYGPPGTGKTYVAEHLARHLVGGGDGFRELVQFHPSYGYEDFIQGIRPEILNDGVVYKLVAGRFKDFCCRAAQCSGLCVLVIDEINRANLSRVFGELMYLLEYRDREIELAGGERFRIPKNVRLIGTMNTADRSIALVDHALRRRFAFLHLAPDVEVLRRFHDRENTGFDPDGLIEQLQQVNLQINDPHYQVGISFFLRPDLSRQIEDIWRMEIEPYLEEYFFDQVEKVEALRWEKVEEKVRG